MPAKLRTWLYAFRPLAGSVLATAVVGILLVTFWPLENLSYALGTWLKPTTTITNAVIVYFDQETLNTLGTGADRSELSRTNYARLLDVLAQNGAGWVFMDVLFNQPDSEPDADEILARAIRAQGHVVLAADLASEPVSGGGGLETLIPPIGILASAANGRYGHVRVSGNMAMIISDYPPLPGYAAFTNSAVWVAATNIDPQLQGGNPNCERWLNYYCPPFIDEFPQLSLQDAVSSNFPRGFLAGKIVFVGQNVRNGDIASMNDICGTPYSFFGSDRSPGVVINAMEVLNLIRGDWLRRTPRPWQWLGAILWAIVSVGALYSLSRKPKIVLVLAAVPGALALCAVSFYMQWRLHWFWSWIGPAFAQTPLALLLVMRKPKPDRYVAFISYRTEEDGAAALLIARSLAERGLKTFIDVRSLHAGKFDEQLLREIESAAFFILILSPNSLARCVNEGDWVLKELDHALTHHRKIIPIFKSDFSFDARQGIPDLPQITELRSYQGVKYSNTDFDGFMEKLKALLKTR